MSILPQPFPPATVTALHGAILPWFAGEARVLPWRQNYSPYHVWLSEVMLQQTQMDRVVGYFQRWTAQLPDIAAVAAAPEEQILKLWEGLGYYSRARNLHRAAQVMRDYHHGHLPTNQLELRALPGIGRYTAAAIMSIAFQADCPVVDGNVERFFSRLLALDLPVKSAAAQEYIWRQAAELLPQGQARPWNQALMELGALICRRGTPRCDLCPARALCRSYQSGTTATRPVAGPRPRITEVTFVAAVIVQGDKIYVQKRLPGDTWGNLWEFPGGHLEAGESVAEAVVREVREETEFSVRIQVPLPTIQHSFTRYRATLHAFLCQLQDSPATPVLHAASEYRWLTLAEVDELAFSAGHRKLIGLLRLQERDWWQGG